MANGENPIADFAAVQAPASDGRQPQRAMRTYQAWCAASTSNKADRYDSFLDALRREERAARRVERDASSCGRLDAVIDSTMAHTGTRWTSSIRRASLRSESTSAGTASWSRCSPRPESKQTSSFRRLSSNPACNTVKRVSLVLAVGQHREGVTNGGPPSWRSDASVLRAWASPPLLPRRSLDRPTRAGASASCWGRRQLGGLAPPTGLRDRRPYCGVGGPTLVLCSRRLPAQVEVTSWVRSHHG